MHFSKKKAESITFSKRLTLPLYCMALHGCLPKTVKIAVGVDSDELIAGNKRKDRLRFARKRFALIALFGLDGKPIDKVLREHRVINSADRNFDNTVMGRGDDRKMLFRRGLHGVGNKLGHLHSAAQDRDTFVFNKRNDIAAVLAFIKFHIRLIRLLSIQEFLSF